MIVGTKNSCVLLMNFMSNTLELLKRRDLQVTKPYNTLRKKMSLAARKTAAAKTQGMLKEMPLQELRQAHQMSQERLAELLLTKQANVSRIERRTDMYISTLRSYIEAMGGN